MITNGERIKRARHAVLSEAFWHGEVSENFNPATGTEEAVIDLITNLLHLAHNEGLDPAAVVRMAVTNFEAEVDS